MTSFFPPRESLVSDIPAGDGNIEKFFTVCTRLVFISGQGQVVAVLIKMQMKIIFVILNKEKDDI
jgi:hypothetical protein